MFVVEELKLNKFRDVQIPSGREYFARYGQLISPADQYTGDEVAQMPQNKVDSFADYQRYAEQMADQQAHDQDSD